MRHRTVGVLLLLLMQTPGRDLPGQTLGAEQEIRVLEDRERLAVLAEDTAALSELWTPEYFVNNPGNTVSKDRAAVFALIAAGRIRHARFERRIEEIRVDGDVAVVMGGETVAARVESGPPAAPVERRFTHVWRRTAGRWRLVARHANRVPPPEG
jgi:uncharacterized protein (TIGR02246 family)